MEMNQKWYHQTGVIIAAFIIFWPVGIYFLVSRNNASKKGMFIGGINEQQSKIIGGILCAIGVLALFGNGFDSSMIMAALIYIGGGIAVISYGKKNELKIRRYKTYVDMIVNNNVTSIDIIASKCGINYDQCKNELNTLIGKNVFYGAVINDMKHSISITKKAVNPTLNNGVSMVDVKCSGCGAVIAAPKGSMTECEYCGNQFKV